MAEYKFIHYEVKEEYAEIRLNRPEKRNAFHAAMIDELLGALDKASADAALKALVIRGEGSTFSAGADIQWMQAVMEYTYEENLKESEKLAKLFNRLYHLPLTVIALVHGTVAGGANGLVAAADIVFAAPETTFRFSEVKLGLVPATIAPYVIQRMPLPSARYYMLSATPFNAQEALDMGYVTRTVKPAFFEGELEKLITRLRENGRNAMQETKRLLNAIAMQQPDALIEHTTEVIARARTSREGQQRMRNFFKK